MTNQAGIKLFQVDSKLDLPMVKRTDCRGMVVQVRETGCQYVFSRTGLQPMHGRLLKDSIITRAGRFMWPLEPHSDDFDITDIAWGLAKECRFGNQVAHHLSVARHCAALSWIAPEPLRPWALIHDCSEAYLRDIPRPLKRQMPIYSHHENNLLAVMAGWFGLNPVEPEELKEYDHLLGQAEMIYAHGDVAASKLLAMGYDETYIANLNNYMPHVGESNVYDSYHMWLDRYRELFPEHAKVHLGDPGRG